jgi:hypothetical protein
MGEGGVTYLVFAVLPTPSLCSFIFSYQVIDSRLFEKKKIKNGCTAFLLRSSRWLSGCCLHRLLHLVVFPSCDVRCFSMAPTIESGFPVCVSHMRGLRLWEILTGDLKCTSCSAAPFPPNILEKASDDQKQELIAEYDDLLSCYEPVFAVYRAWLDDNARAGAILAASMDDHLATNIVDFYFAHQMWPFLRYRYAPTRQFTYLAAIRQEQLLR